MRQNAEQHARDNRLHSIGPSDIYASQPPQDKLFPSPIDFAYEAHVGPVHSISCSPFHRNLFLSCGADGSISLYSLLQAKPLLTLDPSPTYMMSVAWSKVRPLVFSATSEDGITFIYDLGTSLRQHVVEVNSSAASGDTSDSMGDKGGNSEYNSSRHRRPSTTCVAFNPRQRSLFATGNSNGTFGSKLNQSGTRIKFTHFFFHFILLQVRYICGDCHPPCRRAYLMRINRWKPLYGV